MELKKNDVVMIIDTHGYQSSHAGDMGLIIGEKNYNNYYVYPLNSYRTTLTYPSESLLRIESCEVCPNRFTCYTGTILDCHERKGEIENNPRKRH